MPKVEFKRVETDEEVENINIKDGQLIYSKTGKTFMDYGNERIPTGSGGSSVEVDTEMSDTSENAVQNKVIKQYVDSQTVPEEVVIDDEEPTDPDVKLWIDTGEVQNVGSELPLVYPVGSIYMSVNNTNPAILFGFGTWERIKDTFLLSAGDTYTAGDTGGEATHSHDLSNAYAKLVIGINNKMYWSENSKIYTVNRETSGTSFGANGSSITSTKAIDLGGNTNESSSMPPYLVVYMWKRTA